MTKNEQKLLKDEYAHLQFLKDWIIRHWEIAKYSNDINYPSWRWLENEKNKLDKRQQEISKELNN